MLKFSLRCCTAALLCAAGLGMWPLAAQDKAPIPNFAPDAGTAWTSDRPQSDDFLPPPSGAGPVLSDPAHPYVPNGQGQPTYRVADLTNPILKPWVIERMRKANEAVLAGQVPFIARERCWPAGFPPSTSTIAGSRSISFRRRSRWSSSTSSTPRCVTSI